MAQTRPGDPAYFLLEKGLNDPYQSHLVKKAASPYKEGCYICEDPEFALMGLPLCYHCFKCGGHVAADDCTCDACGIDQREEVSNG